MSKKLGSRMRAMSDVLSTSQSDDVFLNVFSLSVFSHHEFHVTVCGMCFAEAHLGASQAGRKLIFSSNLKTSRPRGPATQREGV